MTQKVDEQKRSNDRPEQGRDPNSIAVSCADGKSRPIDPTDWWRMGGLN